MQNPIKIIKLGFKKPFLNPALKSIPSPTFTTENLSQVCTVSMPLHAHKWLHNDRLRIQSDVDMKSTGGRPNFSFSAESDKCSFGFGRMDCNEFRFRL